MLLSLSLMMLSGLLLGWLCSRVHLPRLFGMILAGMLLGPYVLNWIDPSILSISSELRRIALIIILLRAGLSLDVRDLIRVGRPAVLLCFVPACFEMIGTVTLAPRLLGLSMLDSAILGAVIAAVSPAVIVPKMLRLMDEQYGTAQGIPQMILAGASVDDVFVIVLFSTFTGLAQGSGASAWDFLSIPVSIVVGIAVGCLTGFLLAIYFGKVHLRDTVKVLILLCVALLLVSAEDMVPALPFASLIAVMCIGIALQRKRRVVAARLSAKCNKLWVFAEILLFVLVGASVDLTHLKSAGASAVVLVLGVLVFRMAGVFVCVLGTKLNRKERLFCMIAYTPKATVQAAIGGLPLAMGLSCGDVVLTLSVVAILITAPLGAFLIEGSYKRLLRTAEPRPMTKNS
ncbi:MAG: cation:proton antiporter [Butyricicoccus sp.]